MAERAKILTTDAEIDFALRTARLAEKFDARVLRASYSERTDRFQLHMSSGATLAIPRKLLEGLAKARASELSKIELLGSGRGLYWPALDVAHQVSGLLAGVYGTAKWMSRLRMPIKSATSERVRRSA